MDTPDARDDPRVLPPIEIASGLANVYVECARGSGVKARFDVATGTLRFHKHMPAGMIWPFAYGFACGTRAADGDALDAVVLAEKPVEAGRLVKGRVLGAIEGEQTAGGKTFRNDRLLVADASCPLPGRSHGIAGLAIGTVEVIEGFFVEYNRAQGRAFRVLGRLNADAAFELVRAATVPTIAGR